ncbi:hypothetical protein BY458DRAFT_554893 [Sporodiniella umbellata]|nr:hypothetical protein BY458DRAFT_554893 [Sporodiniella umbellata]
MPLEDVQKVMGELSSIGQFVLALIGIFITLKPFFQHMDALLPKSVVDCLSIVFQTLGLLDITYYLRPKEYYEKRSKELKRSALATIYSASHICINSPISPNNPSIWASGLKNTGNSCFMNSVLQALSALPYLHQHLNDFSKSASGISLPVARSLLLTLRRLVKPVDRQFYLNFFYQRIYFNPTEIVTALSSNRRIISREQQDAEEFFQLVSSALDTEGQRVAQASLSGGGLKSLIQDQKRTEYCNPFTGLLASRLSCLTCGYTVKYLQYPLLLYKKGAIRHFAFNNIQLNVPNKSSATLGECLSQLTAIEYLDDVSCRLCSFKATLRSLEKEIQGAKKKKKLIAKKKLMEKTLKENQIENEEIECVRTSGKSTKQVMVAKPPKILCLHVSRSAYLQTGMVYKNPCHLLFPEVLDLAPFATGGDLNTTNPRTPISVGKGSRVLYELMSVVVHYGSHSSGHFVAYKRCIYSDGCACSLCQKIEDYAPQDIWYRISDTKVDKCHIEDVLNSNPYMLFYEIIEGSDDDFEDGQDSKESLKEADTTKPAQNKIKKPVENKEIKSAEDKAKDLDSELYNSLDEAAKEALLLANALMAQDAK